MRCNASTECRICKNTDFTPILHQYRRAQYSQSVFSLHISIKMMSRLQNFMTMARKKNIPEEEIVNVTCEEVVLAEETLVDTTQSDETGVDTESFSVDSPDTILPVEESAEMSETLPTVDETAEETLSLDGGDAWGEAEESSKLYEEKAELPDTVENLNVAPI